MRPASPRSSPIHSASRSRGFALPAATPTRDAQRRQHRWQSAAGRAGGSALKASSESVKQHAVQLATGPAGGLRRGSDIRPGAASRWSACPIGGCHSGKRRGRTRRPAPRQLRRPGRRGAFGAAVAVVGSDRQRAASRWSDSWWSTIAVRSWSPLSVLRRVSRGGWRGGSARPSWSEGDWRGRPLDDRQPAGMRAATRLKPAGLGAGPHRHTITPTIRWARGAPHGNRGCVSAPRRPWHRQYSTRRPRWFRSAGHAARHAAHVKKLWRPPRTSEQPDGLTGQRTGAGEGGQQGAQCQHADEHHPGRRLPPGLRHHDDRR